MLIGNLGRFGLVFSGMMILVMAGIVSLARIGASNEVYFLMFWCNCDGSPGYYRMNSDGSGLERIANSSFNPNLIFGDWSPDAPTLTYASVEAGANVLHQMRWDGRADRVLLRRQADYFQSVWMPDGESLLVESGGFLQPSMTLERLDLRTGDLTVIRRDYGANGLPSPDGQWLAHETGRSVISQLHVMPIAGGSTQQLTDGATFTRVQDWSPDGERILFTRVVNEGGMPELIELNDVMRDGSDFRLLYSSGDRRDAVVRDATYSPDGAQIVFNGFQPGHFNIQRDIAVLPADGGDAVWLTNTGDDEYSPVWSPDGRWIVFMRFQLSIGGNALVRVRPDSSDEQTLLVIDRGSIQSPRWSASYAMDWEPGIAVVVGLGMVLGGLRINLTPDPSP